MARKQGNAAVLEQPGVTTRPEVPFGESGDPGVTKVNPDADQAPADAQAPVAPPVEAITEQAADAQGREPKVNQPHAWVGRRAFYWRTTNQTTKEISALPATLIEPIRGTEGWVINFLSHTTSQWRRDVKYSDTPRAGYFTLPKE